MKKRLRFSFVLILIFLSGSVLSSPVASASLHVTDDAHAATAPQQSSDHDESDAGHGDPFAEVFEILAIILLCAVIGRFAARKLKQSPVLGELIIGIVIGAILYQFGWPTLTIIRHNDLVHQAVQNEITGSTGWRQNVQLTLEDADLPEETTQRIEEVLLSEDFPAYSSLAQSILLFSSLGVILLLFMVGLESSVHEMKEVGGSATGVALLGVVLPFILGYFTTLILIRGVDHNVPIFMGATLCATSIGITARVFKDMNRLGMSEAKIVLGAAVLDDILGLVVLAIVAGIVTSGSVHFSTIGLIVLKAALFLGTVIFFGITFLKKNIAFFARLDQSAVKLIYPFALLMLLAWLADLIGLATIVGAFAAGLIIEEEHFLTDQETHQKEASVESILAPIEGIFAPVFFVLMGMQVDVTTFAEINVLLVGLALTVVAIIGKVAASLILKKGDDKLIVGIGMVPRGEVGLIFASIGKALGVVNNELFSIIIIVVLLTTLVTPPMLTWAIGRKVRTA